MSENLHIVPLNDLREHIVSIDCHCKPYQDPKEPLQWIHNSWDGREFFEFSLEELKQTNHHEVQV